MQTICITGSVKVDPNEDVPGKASLLLKLLRNSGYKLTTSTQADFLLSIDHNQMDYQSFIRFGGKPSRTFLLRLEPEAVYPSQYKMNIYSMYGTVFSPGRVGAVTYNDKLTKWPYEYHYDPNYPSILDPKLSLVIEKIHKSTELGLREWKKRSIDLSLIASNKVSPISKENYTLRRKLAKELNSFGIEIYGDLWQPAILQKIRHRAAVAVFAIKQGTFPNPKSIYGNLLRVYPNAKGPVLNKHKILSDSKFTLIVENSMEIMTEKIFDAFTNGVIPIYVGPSMHEFGFPRNIAFQCTGKSDEIIEFVSGISEAKVQEMLNAAQVFLTSDIFLQHYTEEAVYNNLLFQINSVISNHSQSE